MSFLTREPAASRKTLILTAGMVWIVVGLVLAVVAVTWLSVSDPRFYMLAGAALIAGLAISRFGFSRISGKNVERIRHLSPHKERICIFAFQAIQSYLLVLVMIAMGYVLRHLPIPHVYLAAIYMTIGIALLKSGLGYVKAARTF